ncbi:hypothetical protein I5168_09145 [Nonlabens sp. SCSIO 43208]|uniref:DUF6495 family protein n=1 Tax=Nonlabens sp. SCSIO 43208 TaxID=2793009 RepID=UPI003D6C25C1
MKYRRLTKEQLEEMHEEFIKFLAAQSIDKKEWDDIKNTQLHVAEQEIDVFSDLVWEGVLNKAEYLEHISAQSMNLFHTGEKEMSLISIIIGNKEIDITTTEGYKWLQDNLLDESVKLFTATKAYGEFPNEDKFKIIESGAVITKGQLYQYFENLVELGN